MIGILSKMVTEYLKNYCPTIPLVVFSPSRKHSLGISGKTIQKRPAIKSLLRDIEEGKIQEVLVWKLDRISRKISDLLIIVDHLNKHDVKFRSFSEKNFDTETASGKLSIQMLGVIAEFQRNTIVENVKMGMKQRARNGKWNGGTVLGYDVVEVLTTRGKESALQINHIEAELVRKIFRMYAAGQGLKSTANQLNKEGFKTKPGNYFNSVSVKTIINNPIYIGKIRYNVRENWNEKRRKGTNKDPILVDGEHAPILTEEIWEAVQMLYKKKAVSAPRKFDGIYLLTGLMRCPQCGASLIAHRINGTLKDGSKVVRRYYVCSNFRNKGSRVCNSNSVRADIAENFVVERIGEVACQPKVLEDIVKKINQARTKDIVPAPKGTCLDRQGAQNPGHPEAKVLHSLRERRDGQRHAGRSHE
jgi:site-specific DNA recombinase